MNKTKYLSNIFITTSAKSAFTIVELLVVIVVIGILATITIVSYTGISSKATISSLQSDLNNAKKQLNLYYVDNGAYPASLSSNCPVGPNDARYCLKPSSGTTFDYSNLGFPTSPQGFALKATKNSTNYIISNTTAPISANPSLSCPTGFIPVPGSITYGTIDFCVMKYEAKQVGVTTTPISQVAGTPWVSIDQPTAITNSQNVAGCTGCHLITEAEWLTIAQNVLSVASNWDNGAGVHAVGTGYIYSGHNDNVPANTLDADANDNNGYYGTGNVSPSNQRRTLTLTNGEVIWDFAGNVWEWTSGNITTNQPGIIGAGLGWREWTAITNIGSIYPNPSPTATGIAGASSWNSSQGVGTIYSNSDNIVLKRYFCGGSFSNVSNYTGVLALNIEHGFDTYVNAGFRVAR